MRQISAPITSFYQFVFAPVFILGPGLLIALKTIIPDSINDIPLAPIIIAWTIGVALSLPMFRWVTVHTSGDSLHIRRFGKTGVVPLTNISGFGYSRLLAPETVTIHFAEQTDFGHAATFLPPSRLWAFKPHPVISELQIRVASARKSAT